MPLGVAVLDRGLLVTHANAGVRPPARRRSERHRRAAADQPAARARSGRRRASARRRRRARPSAAELELQIGGGSRDDAERSLVASARPLLGQGGSPGGLVLILDEVTDELRRSRYIGALQALAVGPGCRRDGRGRCRDRARGGARDARGGPGRGVARHGRRLRTSTSSVRAAIEKGSSRRSASTGRSTRTTRWRRSAGPARRSCSRRTRRSERAFRASSDAGRGVARWPRSGCPWRRCRPAGSSSPGRGSA